MSEMKLDPIFKIYEPIKYSYNKKKEDYVIIPLNNSDPEHINRIGSSLTFQVNSQSDYILLSDAFIRCDFKLTNDAGNAIPVGNITLENNFFPSLFSSIVLHGGSTEVERITSPGEFDTILKTIIYPKDYDSDSSWIPDVGNSSTVQEIGEIGDAATEATNLVRTNQMRLAALA